MSIRQLILRNFWLKALSILVAVLIWVVVQSQISGGSFQQVFQGLGTAISAQTESRSFALTLHRLQTAGMGRPVRVAPSAVTVTVQGEPAVIRRLQARDLRAYVDLVGLDSANGASVSVRVDLPQGIQLKDCVPAEVRVETLPIPNENP